MRKSTEAQLSHRKSFCMDLSTNISIPVSPSIHPNRILLPDAHCADTILIIILFDGVVASCNMTQNLLVIAQLFFFFF